MNDSVECINEIFLLDIQGRTGTNFYDLKDAQQACHDVLNAIFTLAFCVLLKLKLEKLSQDVYQIPNNFDVDELSKLRDPEEDAFQEWGAAAASGHSCCTLSFEN